MENILNIIDTAIKRLVSPVAMLVAAGILISGKGSFDNISLTYKILFVLLVISAIAYTLLSVFTSVLKFLEIGYSRPYAYLFSLSFSSVYAVMFYAAIKIGFDKIA